MAETEPQLNPAIYLLGFELLRPLCCRGTLKYPAWVLLAPRPDRYSPLH
jgi:hypothetical protein